MLRIFALFFFTTLLASGFVKGGENGIHQLKNSRRSKEEKIGIYELKNENISVKVTNLGASIVSVVVPDKHGNRQDVVLGYDSVAGYLKDSSYLGAIVGRVANRIRHAQFTLNGTHYRLVANEGNNTLNGGSKGFNRVVWGVGNYEQGPDPHITFIYYSFDGEQGFPGDLSASVTYTLSGPELIVTITALAPNKPTPVSLSQYTYWNLGGHNSGDILSNEIQINGSYIAAVNRHLIATGKIISVRGTPYDFLNGQIIGSRIKKLHDGYDINYLLNGGKGKIKRLNYAATVHDKKSGRVLEVWTNAPSLLLSTGDHLKNIKGKGGHVYKPNAGLLLATQGLPDAVNHPNFPSQIVRKEKPYRHFVVFKFSTRDS